MSPGPDRRDASPAAVARYRRRLQAALLFDRLSFLGGIAFFVAGAWLLGVKRLAPDLAAWNGVVGWSCLGLTVAGAVWGATRRSYSRSDSAAYADWHAHAGGLILATDEIPDDRWRPYLDARLEDVPRPLPRWDRQAVRLLPGAVFCLATVFVPVVVPEWQQRLTDVGETALADVQKRIDDLDREKLLDDAERETLAREMKRIRRELDAGRFTQKEWEALDAVKQRLGDRLDRAKDAIERTATAMKSAEKSLQRDGRQMARERKLGHQRELESALRALNAANLFDKMPADLENLEDWLKDMESRGATELGNLDFGDALGELREFLTDRIAELKPYYEGEDGL